MGLVLGWACFPAILVALVLQMLFFQYGGLLVLGVNTATMALPALLCFYLFRPWMKHNSRKRGIAAFTTGFLAILGSSMLMALALASTDQGFLQVAKLIVVAHFPLMCIEGIITMFAVTFLAKVQPEFLCLEKR
jgi:cobalt/nickel transport system permease protein